ncbi:MAG TPA: PrsW family glutamic-type intramembrane protease, partial [Mycobacteriales bacterium]|nr:PrsW family glutamic-type intramembrane protease [Mycobacteriales bacterium]
FAALETMGYAFVTLIQSQGNVAAVESILLLRGLLSPAAHMAWTGLTATALWYAADHGWKGGAVLRFLAVFVLAVALHTTWDSVGTIPVYIVLSLISLGLLTWFAHLLSRGSRLPEVLQP